MQYIIIEYLKSPAPDQADNVVTGFLFPDDIHACEFLTPISNRVSGKLRVLGVGMVTITKDGMMCYDGIPDDNILVKSRGEIDANILKDLLKEKI